jgi:hypothetical protein
MSLYDFIAFAKICTNVRVSVCYFKVVKVVRNHKYATGSIFTKYNQIGNIFKPFETGFNPHPIHSGSQLETLEALGTSIRKRVDSKL